MKQGEVLLQNGEGDDLTGAVLILAGSMFEIASALHSIAGSFDYGLTITTVKE